MRTIFLLRGTPASGKSTWVEQNKLQQYTLSADNIRLMYQSPVLNNNGDLVITQQNDGKVWQFLFEMLEDRMRRGEFVIVDATHYKSELLNRYKTLISKYRYRAFVVDFTNIPLETLLQRNSQRDAFKRVPEEVIRKMVNNPKFQTALKQKIGSKIDTSELDKEKVVLNKQLQQAIGAKNKIAEQMDRLDITDKHYVKMR